MGAFVPRNEATCLSTLSQFRTTSRGHDPRSWQLVRKRQARPRNDSRIYDAILCFLG